MTGRHDYPELADRPVPIEQTTCAMCGGSGWKETHLDDNLLGHGDKCWNCAGRGYVWTEVQHAKN